MSHSDRKLRVAVIGAGPCGLTAAKWLLQTGHTPVVFERADRVGGVWRYDAGSNPYSPAYASLTTNSSRLMMEFSDFPFPFETDHFPVCRDIQRYLEAYVDAFHLRPVLRLGCEVTRVQPCCPGPAPDWIVRWEESASGALASDTFDTVVTASGQFVYEKSPQWRGQADFGSPIVHSLRYWEPKAYADKRLVVVGFGNSSLDMTLEMAPLVKSLHVSIRTPPIIIPAIHTDWSDMEAVNVEAAQSSPMDQRLLTRYVAYDQPVHERAMDFLAAVSDVQAAFMERGCPPCQETNLVRANYSVLKDPKSYVRCLRNGSIRLAPDVSHLSPHRVHFVDGTSVECDVLLLCTGYKNIFPYLFDVDGNPVQMEGKRMPLYQHIKHSGWDNLYLSGMVDTLGSVFVTGEMQARWICAHVNNALTPPLTAERQTAWLKRFDAKMDRLRSKFPRFENYVRYMDALGAEIGVGPPKEASAAEPDFSKLPVTAQQFVRSLPTREDRLTVVRQFRRAKL